MAEITHEYKAAYPNHGHKQKEKRRPQYFLQQYLLNDALSLGPIS